MMIKIGDFRIAPRPRFRIYDEEVIVNLNDSVTNSDNSCTGSSEECTSPVKDREIIFKMRFIGQGDCNISTNAYREFETFLAGICGQNLEEYYKRICDEEPLIYTINRAYIRPLDLELEYGCDAIRTGEVHLFTTDINEGTEIASLSLTVPKSGT